MTTQSYASTNANSSPKSNTGKTPIPLGPVEKDIFWWLKDRMHPLRWAINNPWTSPSSDEIKNGLAGKTRANGGANKINLYNVPKCIHSHNRLYLCSGDKRGFLWSDIDAHNWWQNLNNAYEAAQIVQQHLATFGIGGSYLIYSSSYQGVHGVIPICFEGLDLKKVCKIYDRFQDGVRRLLFELKSVVWDTTETKGHPPHFQVDGSLNCGSLCRLPIEQGWEVQFINHLIQVPDVPISRIQDIAEFLVAKYPPTVPIPHPPLEFLASLKTDCQSSILSPPFSQSQPPTSTTNQSSGPSSIPQRSPIAPPALPPAQQVTPPSSSPPQQHISQHSPHSASFGSILPIDDLKNEPDARKRQHRALIRLAHHLKRVPSECEALDFIESQQLYSPPWEQNLSARKRRVRGILKYIDKSFDPRRCCTGDWVQNTKDRLDRMRAYVRQFYEGKEKQEGVAVFLTIAEYCLIINPNDDKSVPREGFEALWGELVYESLTTIKWDKRRWKRLRDYFDEMGIISVEKVWGPGKAMRWHPEPKWPSQSTSSSQNE